MALKLTMTCGPYDRARALIDGSVTPDGIELEVTVDADDVGRQGRLMDGTFDIGESFAGLYIGHRATGTFGFTAIPVFVKRMFRHSYLYVSRRSGIRSPSDLNGRRIGLQNWFTTMSIWGRTILVDEFGVDLSSITWVAAEGTAGDARRPPGWQLPDGVTLEWEPGGKDIYGLLASGAIDAAMTTEVWAPDVHPNIDFLMPDYADIERAYHARTGFFPIHHLIVVRDSVLAEHPWVAMRLFDAWQASKRECYRWLAWQRVHQTSLWFRALWEEERARAGDDPYAWGFAAGKDELAALLAYAFRDGLTPRLLAPHELFHPTTLAT